jgi:hypothetical protein
MFHPSILEQYSFNRDAVQMNPIDACADVAEYHEVPVHHLARFLVTMGIDADRLSLLA